MVNNTKKCSKCRLEKELKSFNSDKSRKDGLRSFCMECARDYSASYRLSNLDYFSAYARQHRLENKNEYSRYNQDRYEQDPEKFKAQSKVRYEQDPEKFQDRVARRAKLNPHKINAYVMKRNAKKIDRTPQWLTEVHFNQIQLFYETATQMTKEIGIPFEVDHIVPLQGENVSGLHVPWNLQVLTKKENCSKGNEF